MAPNRSVASTSRSLSVDEKTVREYVEQDDLSPEPQRRNPRASRLDAHAHLIDRWLEEDESGGISNTAKKTYERLVLESHHPGSTVSSIWSSASLAIVCESSVRPLVQLTDRE